jgi:hypothetical protein
LRKGFQILQTPYLFLLLKKDGRKRCCPRAGA